MSKRLIFTLDLEEHRPDDSYPKRYPAITHDILDFLEARSVQATVFVLGRLADAAPELIKEIHRRGHEIAFHSHAHVHLTDESPARFRQQTADNKAHLEDLIGSPIIGYRAPAFSLTPKSAWAIDIIAELGFAYSSSILPAKNPIFGFPGAPKRPFRWGNGLLEIPAPVAQMGPMVVPFLGGFYLRYFPTVLIKQFLNRGGADQCYWLYCHPHDFDHKERFYRIEGTSLLVSMLLWFNRKRTFKKLEALFPVEADYAHSRSFAALLAAGDFSDVPRFEP